jgi:hypothetical protein
MVYKQAWSIKNYRYVQDVSSTTIPIDICEDVPVQVANNCLILTDFVVLEMPEDDNMSIIRGIPFINTAGAVIDCNQG